MKTQTAEETVTSEPQPLARARPPRRVMGFGQQETGHQCRGRRHSSSCPRRCFKLTVEPDGPAACGRGYVPPGPSCQKRLGQSSTPHVGGSQARRAVDWTAAFPALFGALEQTSTPVALASPAGSPPAPTRFDSPRASSPRPGRRHLLAADDPSTPRQTGGARSGGEPLRWDDRRAAARAQRGRSTAKGQRAAGPASGVEAVVGEAPTLLGRRIRTTTGAAQPTGHVHGRR